MKKCVSMNHLNPQVNGVTQKGDTRGLNKVIKESITVGNDHTGCCLTIKESITITINYWGSTEVWVSDSRPLELP